VPLSFEANQGQTDPEVRFLSRASGYSLFLTSSEAVMVLSKSVKPEQRTPAADNKLKKINRAKSNSNDESTARQGVANSVLRMRVVGANPQARVSGLKELTRKSNHYLGKDPDKWVTGAANFGQVKYESILPGIDLIYYGNQSQLEYDFIVAPDAKPGDIEIDLEGARTLRINPQGDLLLGLAERSELRQIKPFIYQEVNGNKREVVGKYILKGSNRVGFEVSAYDATKPLIIDPKIVYATYLGGIQGEVGTSIAVDSSGNTYITGTATSSNFPTRNPVQGTRGDLDYEDVFVTKLNASGSDIIYSTFLGGIYGDDGNGIAIDASGNAYVVGVTGSPNYPVFNAFQSTGGSSDGHKDDAFITKLNPNGSLAYSTYLGGDSADDSGSSIAVDAPGNAYITGYAASTNFPTLNQLQGLSGPSDAFVAKLSATGVLLFSTYLGGSSYERGFDISVDNSNVAYITGLTFSTNFPTTPGALPGSSDRFTAKLSITPSGGSLIYSTTGIGGFGIAVDSSGSAYIAGTSVSKLNPAGSGLIYSVPMTADIIELALDADKNAYVTGSQSDQVFVAKVDTTGEVEYTNTFGGSASDYGWGIAVDSDANVYVTGGTTSTNFPVTAGAFQTVHGHDPNIGGNPVNAFVLKLTDCPCDCPAIPMLSPRG
jgi:Beta-propeller repeat